MRVTRDFGIGQGPCVFFQCNSEGESDLEPMSSKLFCLSRICLGLVTVMLEGLFKKIRLDVVVAVHSRLGRLFKGIQSSSGEV